MTFTIETTPEREMLLKQEAARRGLSVDELAKILWDELLEDLEDAASAERVLANTNPNQWRSLDELRKAVRG